MSPLSCLEKAFWKNENIEVGNFYFGVFYLSAFNRQKEQQICI